jgi:soluble lytic murein transglycosylase-like protein
MGPTAAQYGVNVNDLSSSANGAAHYLADLIKMFHGDLAKAAAAYNWGQGNLQKDIAKHGNDWLRYAPKETQAYVAKTTGIRVTVNNNTGGNANVGVNQAAAGAGQ